MEHIKEKSEDFTDHLGDYIETQMKLFALRATKKSAEYLTSAVTIIFISTFLVFVFFFTGIGLGFWIGYALENMLAGFCIVGGFYLLLIILLLALRKNLILNTIRNYIIKKNYG